MGRMLRVGEIHAPVVWILLLLNTQRAFWAGSRCSLLADLSVFTRNDLTGKPGFNVNRTQGTQPAGIISLLKGNACPVCAKGFKI